MMKINFNNHIVIYKVTFFYYLIGIGVLYYLDFKKSAIIIFGIYWVIDLIPALYLHLEYWLKNKGEEYKINSDEIIRYKNGMSTKYESTDVEKVIVYKSASMDKGGMPGQTHHIYSQIDVGKFRLIY